MSQLYEIPCDRAIGDWDYDYSIKCHVDCSALAAETLLHIIDPGRTRALELGAGAMIDSRFMLRSGIQSVVAVDACPSATEYARKVKVEFGPRFEFQNVRFCDFDFVPESFRWVHSNFALPYHGKTGFESLMKAATESVIFGGIFSAIFFGDKDEWNTPDSDLAFFGEREIRQFFAGFDLTLKERNCPGFISGGEDCAKGKERVPKRWHLFKAIARRTSAVL